MEGCSRKELEACPHLLDLISKDAEWLTSRDKDRNHGSSEEKKLELRLGPPGEEWSLKSDKERDESILSLGHFSSMASIAHKIGNQIHKFSSQENPVGCVLSSQWSSSYYKKSNQPNQQQTKAPSFPQFPSAPQSLPVAAKEASQICSSKGIDLHGPEKKVFSPSPAVTAVPNSSQKRTAPASVVGWPPIRSFRKNLGSNSSLKPHSNESESVAHNKVSGDKPVESCRKGMFVKINMDGVPIGRKIDLSAHDSYEKLSSSVDELFRGLLAVQKDSSAGGIAKKKEEKEINGVLDGSGEYTLVYEDNEGDRMLVGDVPWHMFVSTVKRLRVLKSSELPMLCLGSKQDKITVGSKLK